MDLAFHKMAFLEAKMVVATTPQLNILGFKRSKKVKHYWSKFQLLAADSNYIETQ